MDIETISGKVPYRQEIDGMRALAVVAVIINHFSKDILPSGYLGVDMFFVISGFVITSSLANRRSKDFADFLTGFYIRRIKRLVPALVLCVVITSVLICLFDPSPGISLQTGIASLFGFSNIYLMRHSTDYFSVSTELNVFTHTWSLGVEEQFYFLFPCLAWFSGFSRFSDRGAKNLSWVMSGLIVASLTAFISLYHINQPVAYFLMPTRLWELGAGCLLFLCLKRFDKFLHIFKYFPPLLISIAIIAVLFVPLQFAVQATVAVVGLTVLLIACLRKKTFAYKLFTQRQVIYIGLISYSLYLWHWSVLALSRWTIGIHWWSVPIQIALMLVLSITSYHYIETPLRRAEWSAIRLKSIVYGIGASFIASIFLIVLAKPLKGQLFTGNRNPKIDSSSSILAKNSDIIQTTNKLQYACNMTPDQLSGKDYRPKPLIDNNFLHGCIGSSRPDSRKKIVLIGDSFAEVSANHIALIAKKIGYDFKIIFGYGCPYPLFYAQIESRTNKECPFVRENLLRKGLLDKLNKGDIIVLRLYFPKTQYLVYTKNQLPPANAYDKSIFQLISDLSKKGVKLVIIGANPTLSEWHLRSLKPQWFNFGLIAAKIIPSDNQETAYFYLNDIHFKEIFRNRSDVYYFSLTPYLCNSSKQCPLWKNGKTLYFDNQHLTRSAYDLFFDNLYSLINKISFSRQ